MAEKKKKLVVSKKTVKKLSDEDLEKVGGGRPMADGQCTPACTGHYASHKDTDHTCPVPCATIKK